MHDSNGPDEQQQQNQTTEGEVGSPWKPLAWIVTPLVAVILWQVFIAMP